MKSIANNPLPPAQAAPAVVPAAAPPVPPPLSLEQQFGVMPGASGLFLPGAEAAFKGPNAGAMMTRPPIKHAQDPVMPGWLKGYGAGSFLDKLPDKKSSRTALANSLDSGAPRRYDPNTMRPRTKEENDRYQSEIVAGA